MLGFLGLKPRKIQVKRMAQGKYVDGLWTVTQAELSDHLAIVQMKSGFRQELNFGDVESFAEIITVYLNDGFQLRVARERDVADIVIFGGDKYKVTRVDNRPHHNYSKGWAQRLPEDAGFFERRPKG